jgi:hypothetical protein
MTDPATPIILPPSITYAAGASNGVAMMAPPSALMASITSEITKAMAEVPAGSKGALVAVTSKNADGTFNANLAVVSKVGEHVKVMAWMGKSWPAKATYGAATQITW